MPFLDDITIKHLAVKFGEFKGEMRWFVCHLGCPLGAMMDFYDRGELASPYPFKNGQGDGSKTEDEAKLEMQKLKAHVKCVLRLEKKDKKGSSRAWK